MCFISALTKVIQDKARLFDKQWNDVLKYAHDNGITIIGDMPIYVALDSVDVWMNKSDSKVVKRFYQR